MNEKKVTPGQGDGSAHRRSAFPETPWTMLVLARGDNTQAHTMLSEICSMYWYPIYAFVRRQGHSPHDAEDLTQGLFANLLAREQLDQVDREKGKLRSYLLGAVKHYMVHQWRKDHAEKRGGGKTIESLDIEAAEERYREEPTDNVTPESLFDRRWAMTVLEQAMTELEAEYSAKGKEKLYASLKNFLSLSAEQTPYAEIEAATGMSQGAARIAVYRMRKRFRDLVHRSVSATVASSDEIDDEISCLFQALGGG